MTTTTLAKRGRRLAAFLLAAIVALIAPAAASPPEPASTARGQGGLSGSDKAHLVSSTTPARIFRVAVRPGSNGDEVWGIGHVTSYTPGWNRDDVPGQLVFVKNDRRQGWVVAGPPVADGQVVNPRLNAIALTTSGEGWAVGQNGTIAHKAAGSDAWQVDTSLCTAQQICNSLEAISVSPGGLAGYIVGGEGLILRLQGASWVVDAQLPGRGGAGGVDPSSASGAGGPPALVGVALSPKKTPTAPDGDAWAIAAQGTDPAGSGIELYHRRVNGTQATWEYVATKWDALDNPRPTYANGPVRISVKGYAAAAAAADGTVWFGGSFFPVDASNVDSDGVAARPFVLRFRDDGSGSIDDKDFLPYCTEVSNSPNDPQSTSVVSFCGPGSQTLPPGPFPVTSLSALGTGEVLAGGFGLYHFRPSGAGPGVWFREPDPVGYLAAIAFARGDEGWLVSSGGQDVATAPQTTSIAIGHLTKQVEPPDRVARWSDPATSVPYAVAVPTNGAASPVIVGEGSNGDGGEILTKTDVGWEQTGIAKDTNGHRHTLLAAQYAGDSTVAWAVGEAGWAVAVDDGVPKNPEVQLTTRAATSTGKPANDMLYGVAFSDAATGYAVGAWGSIVRYDSRGHTPDECIRGLCWSTDPQSGQLTAKALNAISRIGTTKGFVAVGDDGIVLVNADGQPGGWVKADDARALLVRNNSAPPLYAVDTLADGTIVAGGGRSALIVKSSKDGAFRMAPLPHQGTLLALDARSDGGTLKIVASLAPTGTAKFDGGRSGTASGWLVEFDGARWRDLQTSSNRTRLPLDGLDDAMSRDPVYTIAAEPGGRAGWAVGGRYPGQQSATDKTKYEVGTRSIYRFDLDGSPQSPSDQPGDMAINTPAGGYSFAFFSDASCGAQLCSLTAGTGTASDEVALRIRDEINAASKLKGGPAFVLFGGSSRGSGTAEELGQFAAYLAGFRIPVFGAPGSRDLAPAAVSAGFTPPGLPFHLERQVPRTGGQASGADRTAAYQEAFSPMPAPWGAGIDPARFPDEKSFKLVGSANTACGTRCGRTHYAFDYQPPWAKQSLGRFVVLDTSSGSLAATGQYPDEPQNTFLTQTALPATIRGRTPSFIVMNVPPRNPNTRNNDMILPQNDVATIETAAITAGTTAVFAGGVPVNASYTTAGGLGKPIPYYVAGTGGTPLDGSEQPNDAHYHAWMLATVDPAVNSNRPQAVTNVRTIPVLESVAFKKSIDQTARGPIVVEGGNAIFLQAMGRAIDGGGRGGDQRSMNRLYFNFPLPNRCEAGGDAPSYVTCFNQRGLPPDYRFVSENTAIADFVSGTNEKPTRSAGRLVPDPKWGLLCTFRTGEVWVRFEAGGHQTRMLLNVVEGTGPCVTNPVVNIVPTQKGQPAARVKQPLAARPGPATPVAKSPPVPAPAPAPKVAVPTPPVQPVEPTPVAKPLPKVLISPQPIAEVLPALMPPAPSLLPSPAPPASATAAGAQKQEDKEVEHESAGQEGGDFVAISHRGAGAFDPATGWMLMGMAALLGLFGAAVAAAMKSSQPRPARALVVYPRELR